MTKAEILTVPMYNLIALSEKWEEEAAKYLKLGNSFMSSAASSSRGTGCSFESIAPSLSVRIRSKAFPFNKSSDCTLGCKAMKPRVTASGRPKWRSRGMGNGLKSIRSSCKVSEAEPPTLSPLLISCCELISMMVDVAYSKGEKGRVQKGTSVR